MSEGDHDGVPEKREVPVRWQARYSIGIVAAVVVVTLASGLLWFRSLRMRPVVVRIPPRTPVFRIIEGKAHSVYPYSPTVLTIPAHRTIAVMVTDYLGGCGLVTVFPGLGAHGGTARLRVPIGQTRTVILHASKPGRYRYHCAGDMYFGTIVAR